MPSRHKPCCCLMSYDYQDQDVIINCRLFYSAAGFRPRVNVMDPACDLLVVLRGDPEDRHHAYRGRVHIYDYEKARTIDWRERFPNADEIVLISLDRPEATSKLSFVEAYVPVMPKFWQLKRTGVRRKRLLHLANYKYMPADRIKEQLLALIRSGCVDVYGGNWEHGGVSTRPVSYWQANRMLVRRRRCIGLMYPYQRGKSLSGRMWQAPLQGCHVISEAGTNRLHCPGVIEVSNYSQESIDSIDLIDPERLRQTAADFWQQRTEALADQLGLTLRRSSPRVALECHLQLLADHLQHQWRQLRRQIPGPRRLMAWFRRRLGA